jgi:hypothetical protein
MAGHTWVQDDDWHMYGKITDNDLINTNGIKIYPTDAVCIAYYNANGYLTRPYIECYADRFEIYE